MVDPTIQYSRLAILFLEQEILAGQLRETLPVLLEHVVAVSLAVHLALVTPRARYETLADLIST